ncbi:MAG: TonB-dependent receptor [Acidobacteria bacterium]|nr:TonB-dependent receptor [Acidobacteriota bacterium]
MSRENPLKLARCGFFFVFALLMAASPAQAQTTASIQGAVADETGAVVPGVTISVQNTETGRGHEALSNDQGVYRVVGLPAGRYQLKASLAGFRTVTREGIQLTVGQEATVNLKLPVGEITEELTVRGEAPIIETTVSSVSGVIDTRQMTELPLDGRDFTKLSLLETGTVNVRTTTQGSTKGYGTRVSVTGSRPEQTGYLLDGTDINGFLNFQVPGSAAGVILGVDAVREFRVEVSNFSAEYGRSAGGVFNMVSKSGTNQLHGTLFEFHRNDNLDARNFFAIPDKAEFKRNQFGFSLGGPIVKDHTFFFANYEGLRERRGVPLAGFVPDDNARQGILPTGRFSIPPSVRLVMEELYPRANGPGIGGGVARFFGSTSQTIDEDFLVVKADHNFSERSRFFARYNLDTADLLRPQELPNFADVESTRTQYLTLEESHNFSTSFLNVARFAYNRTRALGDGTALHPISVTFRPGQPLSFRGIQVGGLSNTGGRIDPKWGVQNLFQYTDQAYYNRGRHALKFGVNVERIQFNDDSQRLGTFNFSSLESFLQAQARNLNAAQLSTLNSRWAYRQALFGTYLQDDVRFSPQLTFNLGLRYEFYTVPRELAGKLANLRDLLNDKSTTVGDPFWRNPSLKNFAPRAGVAWNPGGSGKMVVRAGYGIFFQSMTPSTYRSNGARNAPFWLVMNLNNPPADLFPDINKIAERERARSQFSTEIGAIQFNLNSSYEQKFNFTISREIFADMAITAGYLGGRGIHLLTLNKDNVARAAVVNGRWVIPPGAGRKNPNLDEVTYVRSNGQSYYNGFQLKLDRRFSRGLQMRASYTLSKTIDFSTTSIGGTDFGEQGNPQVSDNPSGDRSLSKLHSSQSFALSWVYEFPGTAALSGLAGRILGGWKLNGIWSANSGTPFSANLNFDNAADLGEGTNQRPDLVSGRKNNPINPDNPDQYFDPSAFVAPPPRTYGNLGRNTLIGPGYANLDLGVAKDFALARLGESAALQFRTEFFNILNRAQFANPGSGNLRVFSTPTRVIPTAGKITSTAATNREVQFGLKLIW